MKQETFPESDGEISLLEILVILARHKRLVLGLPLVCAVLAALVSLALPDVYTGTARVLPPQQNNSPIAAALLDTVGGSGTGALVGQALGLKNPSDLYIGMLQSRTIADAIIQRFDLQRVYGTRTLVETRKKVAEAANITSGKDGIIVIDVDDVLPRRAAEIAAAYVEELDKLTQSVAVTAAGRQRVFMEKQLRQAKEQLADAEVALRMTQEKTGIISVTEQGKAMIESVANLRALVAAKQVQLAAMRTATTDRHPDYVRAQEELLGLRHELAKLEKVDPGERAAVIPSAGRIPEAGLEYIRKFRDVQYYQTLFEALAKQYELARSQEASEDGVVQVLDAPVVPDKKSKPNRSLIVLATLILTGMLGVLAAFVLESRSRAGRHPVSAALLNELESHFWSRHARKQC